MTTTERLAYPPEALEAPSAPPPDLATFALMADNLPTLCWIARADGYITWYNRRWHEYCGTTAAEMEGWGWRRVHDPDVLPRVMERWQGCIERGEPFEMTFPLRGADGAFRPFLTRVAPWRDASGAVRHWFGVNTDVSEQAAVAEQNELLSRELSHRIRNIFAVVGSLVMMAARAKGALGDEVRGFARELAERIGALGRAHEFARPHSEESRREVPASTLEAMLRDLLAPYPALEEGRIGFFGPEVTVDDRSATPLALLFHELATNAVKYGALSTPQGRVAVEVEEAEGDVLIRWRERGGPAVRSAPTRQGFGTQLAALSVERQLGGRLRRDWAPEGLTVEVAVQRARLTRPLNG